MGSTSEFADGFITMLRFQENLEFFLSGDEPSFLGGTNVGRHVRGVATVHWF